MTLDAVRVSLRKLDASKDATKGNLGGFHSPLTTPMAVAEEVAAGGKVEDGLNSEEVDQAEVAVRDLKMI